MKKWTREEIVDLIVLAKFNRINKKELARKIGCTVMEQWRWETGKHTPSPYFKKSLDRVEKRLKEIKNES